MRSLCAGFLVMCSAALAACSSSAARPAALPSISRNVYSERIATARTSGRALELAQKRRIVRLKQTA